MRVLVRVRIQRGIPLPKARGGRRGGPKGPQVYPWLDMAVGDSFLHLRGGKTAYSAAALASRRFAPRVFVARRIDDGIRIWRIA